jgi:creatinine amidohydrolase/Fe(II)-dependent formamide hydrolase-like protein
MRMGSISHSLLMLIAGGTASLILAAGSARAAPRAQADLVEFEKMTWVEVKSALAAGKTTALIYTGGVEERGPQDANGGHNLMAHATVEAIARELGNAIFLPVLPYTPNDAEALPGTIGITNELLAAMLERITEESILNGFRNVILMGDHGGGQPQVYEEVAKKLDRRYRPNGIRVLYCDQVYRAANDAFDQYLAQHGYPPGLHGYLFDTSEMMYLDKDNTWVRRDLVSSAVGDPVVGHTAGDGKAQFGPHSPQNGILGDARRSTAELGKRAFDMKVDYAVRQIRSLVPDLSGGGAALPSGNSTAATSSSPASSR